MKSWINKIVSMLPFKRNKKYETEYADLAPIDKIENGAEYLKALGWALRNKKIRNIALAGPYGSGKSSIIETYLKQHSMVNKRSLRISMATFAELTIDGDGVPKRIKIEPDEIELGILKQLFYKVDHKKIPQSRYRKLHKINFWRTWGCLIGVCVLVALIIYIFSPGALYSAIDKIIAAGSPIVYPQVLSFIEPAKVSLILFGIFGLGVLAVLAFAYRSLVSRFKVKEIKLPVDTTVKSGEDSSETVFDKHLDEIVYFFEETKFRVIFFEDLDRLENSSVFIHLRELNTLLNNYNVIKKPVVFVYAVKDDIFSDADRTKFFEFIIPVIPIINSTNSGEILLEKLNSSSEIGAKHSISQSFVLDVSPYISDMRILLNIYNEFIVYKNTLRVEQDLNLLDEPMMALIIFKNLYPRDFADIQMEYGIIKHAFEDKQKCLKPKQDAIRNKIDELTILLDEIPGEALRGIKELKSVFLCEITDWRGIATDIRPNGQNYATRVSQIMQDNFELSQWSGVNQSSVNYRTWDGNNGSTLTNSNFLKICTAYSEREKRIRLIEENRIAEMQRKVENLKLELHDVSGWSLKRLIKQFGSEEILSDKVQENKLLVFLLRKGYVDEKYANYINYFKGNTVTREDMNFILSVKNMEPQPFNYRLTKTSMVIQKLQAHEFRQKEIYNFALLECMLSSNDHVEKLNTYVNQLADEDGRSWEFIDEFVNKTKYQSKFIKALASAWPNMWGYIAKNPVLTYERKIQYLVLLISNVEVDDIVAMNENNEMSAFIEQNEDILQHLAVVENCKVVSVIRAAHLLFRAVSIENVPKGVLDYIFGNNYYELNPLMIQRIVEYKNKDLVSDLDSKNYTTVLKLGYAPLIEYVRENLTHYVTTFVLAKENVFDDEDKILDLLERSIDNQELCIKIIQREELCLEDIKRCCSKQMAEKKTAVNELWNALLENNKVSPTWENVGSYWTMFNFTPNLNKYLGSRVDELVAANSQCIGDDFIRGFISASVDDSVFEKLLPCIQMNDFDIALETLTENKVSIMISCKYFEFTTARYGEIKSLFPDLCAEFILCNQDVYINEIETIEMDIDLFERLLINDKVEKKTAQVLLDAYCDQFMTSKIAENLEPMDIDMNLKIYYAAWKCLNESARQKLMLGNLGLLDADALHSCFTELEKWYSDLIDRSRQHNVELINTLENQNLANRLKEVNYITSYELKEKKEYDPVSEEEKVTIVILCRVKAYK